MKTFGAMLVMTVAMMVCSAPVLAAADAERTVKPVQFAKGATAATLKGRIQGYRYIDYQLRAGAGQRLIARLTANSSSAYFNLLPPETTDTAMYIGQVGDNRFDGLLPDDGTYTLRVYLVRAAARRNEASDFMLAVEVTGQPLAPLPARVDARVAGTRYHAHGAIPCAPAYTQTRQCQAGVIRRGHDGTATVVLQWDKTWLRRILFVEGQPVAADVPQKMTFTRNERDDFVIVFNGDERFEVPEALVSGG